MTELSVRRELLRTKGLFAGYGDREIIAGVSIQVRDCEVVAVVGHNGAGKSTLLKALFGLATVQAGSITYNGEDLATVTPSGSLSRGVVYLPQGKNVFLQLTVFENLRVVASRFADGQDRIDHAIVVWPMLKERLRDKAGTLSGGLRQILALGLSMMLGPRLLLLDEPAHGLAPELVENMLGQLRDMARYQSVSVLVVEHNVRKVLGVADRAYVLRNGQVAYSGLGSDLADESTLVDVYN